MAPGLRSRVAWFAAGALLLCGAAAGGSAWYVAGLFMRPPWYVHRSPEQGLLPRAGDPWAAEHWQGIHRDPGRDFGLDYEDVEFVAVDGSLLRGWLVPAGASTAAVVMAAVGTSVGAVSAILAGAVADEVDAVVAESPAASLDAFIHHLLHSARGEEIAGEFAAQGASAPRQLLRLALPDWWIDLLVRALRYRIGAPDGREPIDLIADIAPRPVLLIHGGADAQVPVQHSLRLYEAAGEPKELWILEGGRHNSTYNQAPTEFRRHVLGFLKRHR